MSWVDDAFEGARLLGERVAAERTARRQAAKDARNARRRARYKAAPPKPKTTVATIDDEYDVPGCRCHVTPMPPCNWCESGGADTDLIEHATPKEPST